MKKVSIIICAYNEEKTIKNVILDIAQTTNEIIVTNDGPTDNTQKIIDKMKTSRFGMEQSIFEKISSFKSTKEFSYERHEIATIIKKTTI